MLSMVDRRCGLVEAGHKDADWRLISVILADLRAGEGDSENEPMRYLTREIRRQRTMISQRRIGATYLTSTNAIRSW